MSFLAPLFLLGALVAGLPILFHLIRRTTRAELRAGTRRVSDPGVQPLRPPSARTMRWLESGIQSEVAMIAIIDSGPGIPPADVERIFGRIRESGVTLAGAGLTGLAPDPANVEPLERLCAALGL